MAKTLFDATTAFTEKLEYLLNSDSPIIASKSLAILETYSLMSNVGTSPAIIVSEFFKVIRPVTAGYKEIISSLGSTIGDLTVPVIEAITDLECSLYQIMKDFQEQEKADGGVINCESVLKKLQNLANTIAQISEVALSGPNIDADVRDSIYVLALILEHFLIMAHGTTTSIAAALHKPTVKTAITLRTCLRAVNPLLSGITAALSTVANSLSESITVLLSSVVNLTTTLNDVLKLVFGFVQDVTVNVTHITQTLTKTVFGTVKGLTGGLGNILKLQ